MPGVRFWLTEEVFALVRIGGLQGQARWVARQNAVRGGAWAWYRPCRKCASVIGLRKHAWCQVLAHRRGFCLGAQSAFTGPGKVGFKAKRGERRGLGLVLSNARTARPP